MVGKLIGKSGETIKHVQNSTGTRIQIDHQLPGETKQVTISGSTADQVTACKTQVEQIVSDEPIAGDTTKSLDCPQGIVGRIIGRGGETIRSAPVEKRWWISNSLFDTTLLIFLIF
jgi:far upstream element-binding protein